MNPTSASANEVTSTPPEMLAIRVLLQLLRFRRLLSVFLQSLMLSVVRGSHPKILQEIRWAGYSHIGGLL
jgi:hypothetical protein